MRVIPEHLWKAGVRTDYRKASLGVQSLRLNRREIISHGIIRISTWPYSNSMYRLDIAFSKTIAQLRTFTVGVRRQQQLAFFLVHVFMAFVGVTVGAEALYAIKGDQRKNHEKETGSN